MSQTEVQLIKDAVIVNADVSNSAAIDVSKISGVMPLAGGTFTGDITIPDKIIHSGDSNTAIRFPSADNVTIETGGVEGFRVYSNSIVQTTQPNSAIGAIIANTTHDSQLQILATASNKNSVIFFGDAADGDIGQIDYDHNDNSLSFVTNATKCLFLDSSGNLKPGSDSNFDIGSSSNRFANGYFDTLYGDGSNLTGITSITISGNVDNRVLTASGSATQINGESALLFNNGQLQIMQETSSSDSKLTVGNSNTPGSGVLRVEFQHGTGNTEGTNRFRYAFVEGYRASGSNDGGLKFGCKPNNAGNPTERMRIDPTGDVLPGTDNAQDLGSSSKRWANVYTTDLKLSNEGSINDVDSTWGNYTIQEGHEDLFLINHRTGKKFKFNLTEIG